MSGGVPVAGGDDPVQASVGHRRARATGVVVPVAVAVVIGIALGLISARYLPQGNPLVTVPWGVAALILGALTSRARRALLVGGAVGFTASYAYLWADDTQPLSLSTGLRLALIILVPAAFGLICGAVAGWLGLLAANAIRRKSEQ
jgi:hypothetical protein